MITTAAVEIADTEGLSGVSMGSVASQVGVATMALYRYVGNKEGLLTAMVDSVIPAPPEPEGMSWRDYLATWTRANRDFLLDRPWVLSIDRVTPPMGPRRMCWLDRALAALAGTTLDEGEKVNAVIALTGYALTDATLVHGMRIGDRGLDDAEIKGAADYGDVLAEVLDPESYPALSAAVRSGVFRGAEGWTEDADFLFGLHLLLDGIEALIARRT
jgi:AcrR family transcriptional regulator